MRIVPFTSQLTLHLSEDAKSVGVLKNDAPLFSMDLNAVHALIEALQTIENVMVEKVADEA